jgi:hypothetical protein
VVDTSKLHVRFVQPLPAEGPLVPRRYTLTHSDATGDLFLTIGPEYDDSALSALQVRLERDEVLGEWIVDDGMPRLELRMMAQGGLPLFGTGAMRCEIFRHYRPMVLGAIRWADRELVEANPHLDDAPVRARFRWRRGDRIEEWGTFGEWR